MNEILPNGQVLHLIDFGVLPKKEPEKNSDKTDVKTDSADQSAQPALGTKDKGSPAQSSSQETQKVAQVGENPSTVYALHKG